MGESEIVTQEPYSQNFIPSDTLDKIINRRDPIEELIDSLKGIRRDIKTGKIIFQSKNPLMNSIGIEAVVRKLKPILSQNVILSNITTREIASITKLYGGAILFDLRLHHMEYGLADTSEMTDVFTICITSILVALKGGEFGFTMEHIAPMYRKTEIIKPEKERKMSFIPSFGGH